MNREVESMARRKLRLRYIAEILGNWQRGTSIRGISRSLGVSRPTIRKYVRAAETKGYYQGGPAPPSRMEVIPQRSDFQS